MCVTGDTDSEGLEAAEYTALERAKQWPPPVAPMVVKKREMKDSDDDEEEQGSKEVSVCFALLLVVTLGIDTRTDV